MSANRPNFVPLAAIFALVAGAVLPWVVTNPFHDGLVYLVHLPGMRSGLELWGLVTLPLAILTSLALLRSGPWTTRVLVLTGLISLAVALSNFTTYGIGGMFVTGPGVYLTFFGGLALLVAATRAPTIPRSGA